MHKIELLLQTLAPKGVEFKTLEEVFEIKNGYTPSKNNPEFWEKGTIPWFRMEDIRENGRILKDSIQHITPKALKNKKLFPKNSIIISTTATIGEHALLIVDSLANQRFTFLSKKADCGIALDMKFFFYQCFLLGEWCKKNTNVSGFASVDMTAFKKYKFPIPPLEIQQEIVKILDAFTELNTELNTELKARKKQYQYYQNMLLDFKDIHQNHKDAKMSAKTYPKRLKSLLQTLAPKGVEFRKLGDIGEYIRGVTYKKNQEINNLECGIKVLRANNITLSNHLNFEDIKVINKNVKIRKEQYLKKNDILICAGSGSSEHIGKVAFINTDFDYVFGGFMGVIRIREVNSRFVYHIFTSNIFKQYLEKSLNTTTINNLNANILQNFLIPIPPLEIQQEIVKILDQFLALTTDLLAGIPAEIKARKKQYEYYREKLLSFKPLTPHKEVKKY
ncbi:restriction endonuclease subunit S [Helicobacter pylori]|uniref:restriction endonuclease subunit S n=1 Tax=Helicobacter pylori TaxID=210 RepID=UPI001FD08561|nr:restriction endonuclease subunit S [Helicobacter pylori]UOR94111.1 restriction endonuclease subunit S [Helicobacter pylori]UOR95535.1 restriction endonuclease subunit S [Helicobacter pylori]